MIMFYDVLSLDDIVCIKEPHEQRRQRLESLIHRVIGRADVGSREKIDFSSRRVLILLRQAFARAII
jgi:DNA ligase-4